MAIDTGTVLAAGMAGVGAVVWLVRLEGRINLSDDRVAAMKEDLQEIKADVKKLVDRK